MFNFEILLIFSPCSISLTFCGQNLCRILIKICAEYCSIFHGEYSRAAGYFANTSFLLHPHFVSAALPLGASTMCSAPTRHQLWHHHKVQIDKHHWHQYQNMNKQLLHHSNKILIVGLRINLPIKRGNYFNVGESFEKTDFFDNQQKCFIPGKVCPTFITTRFHFNPNI